MAAGRIAGGSTVEIAAFFVFAVLVSFAAITDVQRLKIPNWISLALVAGFVLFAPFMGLGWGQAGLHLGVALLCLVVCFGMFAAGWLGAGDAKLMSAVLLWLGAPAATTFIVATALAGGALALALIALRRTRVPLPYVWLLDLRDGTTKVPYGVAIASGALVAFPMSPFWPAPLA